SWVSLLPPSPGPTACTRSARILGPLGSSIARRSADRSIDILEQGVDRRAAARRIRLRPPRRAEPGPRLLLSAPVKIEHPHIDQRDAGSFNHGVSGPQDPRCPRVIALESGRGGKG